MQSVPITTNVAIELESSVGDVYSIQHYVIKSVSGFLRVPRFHPPINVDSIMIYQHATWTDNQHLSKVRSYIYIANCIHLTTSVSRGINTLYIKLNIRTDSSGKTNAHQIKWEGGILPIFVKHLHDRITSLKGEAQAHESNFTSLLFIDVPVPR